MTHITVFGIPNCDTVKKARTWLAVQQISFDFHDFKKQGLTAEQIALWLEHTDLATLINRKGTTWRALSDAQKQSAENVSEAIALMVQNPSLIKRPVLQIQQNNHITRLQTGFQPDLYAGIFSDTP